MTRGISIGAEAARLLAHLADATGPAIHVAASDTRAQGLVRFLEAVAPDRSAVHLPAWDCLPYDDVDPSPAVMGHRMGVLHALEKTVDRVVIASPGSLVQRLPPVGETRAISIGDTIDVEALLEWAQGVGYRADDRVDEPGEIMAQGRVIDVHPADADAPLRIGVEDGRVVSISRYDPVTQRTTGELEGLRLLPATELPAGTVPEPGDLHRLAGHHRELLALDRRMPGAVLTGTPFAIDRADRFLGALTPARDERARLDPKHAPHLPPVEALWLGSQEWQALKADVAVLDLPAATPLPRLADALRNGGRTILVAASARDRGRLARMARRHGEVVAAASWAEALAVPDGSVATLLAPLDHGFRDGDLTVLTARDLLGHGADGATHPAAPVPFLSGMEDLHRGDLVVHETRGLARYGGLESVADSDVIRLEFAQEEMLLVPVADAGLLWRYGHDEGEVALDHVDGTAWNERRAKLSRTLKTAAARLVADARTRAETEVPELIAEAGAIAPVLDGFGWDETPDQAAAIDAVLRDLAAGRPMDRLLVGDVGFGKTEVAIRAVAAAALAGAQVAVIAPTTVLARQHARDIARRLEPAGLDVASLSRLSSPAGAREVRAGLADGTIRVVVGTHALLTKATSFADLGLVVIDEEQRFGRAHKRALRRLGAGLHVLSMTATPIPGSLQEAMVGVQDISVLATAPLRRRPIRTVVAELDRDVLRKVLEREARRGGQSFVVVPRVEDIATTGALLAEVSPDLRVRVAHGKLPAAEIDAEMAGFADGDGDVLLATAIVESGLDVSRANTMVILRPDLFGLAQLHQLRGRVGRGAKRASCWLLTDPEVPVSDAARRRLETLARLDALGAGFVLSQLDLDRRGGGDLAGDRQSGHDDRTGPALHADLLAAALRAARGEGERLCPQIQAETGGRLSEDYIADPDRRATLYTRLGHVRTSDGAERLAEEVEDRFGPPPPAARALLRLVALRALAAERGIAGVSVGPEAVAVEPADGAEPDALPKGARWTGERVVVPRDGTGNGLEAARDLIDGLAP